MQTLAQRKLHTDFPSKNYIKYRSQTKTNPFLQNLNQDTGYPQDILINHGANTTRIQKNYLQDNKKNLKNFFSDRLPPKQAEIFKQSFTIDPAKLFQIKKRQHELKSMTRSKLDQKLDTTVTTIGKLSHNKISQIFQFNDKNQDFKKKFLGNPNVRVSQPYERINHLRGTTSYIKKYNNITKKKAYNSVFGPDPSATKRQSITISTNRQNTSFSRPYTTPQKYAKKVSSSSKQMQRKRFSLLIQKIDKHRQGLDPENKRNFKTYIPPQQQQDNEANKNYLITWIKDTAKTYKYNSIDSYSHKLNELDDLQKLDKQFYQQMLQHKARRLQNRQSLVQNIQTINKNNRTVLSSRNNWIERNNTNRNYGTNKNDLSISLYDDDQCSLSSLEQSEKQQEQPHYIRSGKSLLIKFIRLLVDAILQARFFGIKDNKNIYKAFWHEPDPYQRSGSYAFFKAIKHNDIEAVKKFIITEPDFIYERDHKGRSPLIYAVQMNHTQLVIYLLEFDININKLCFNFKNALYYAIQNQNVLLVKKLLQAGALPWSTKRCSYKNALQKINSTPITNLMKNARKIAIIVKMQQKKPQQVAAWNSLKQKITEQIFTILQ